MQDQYHQASQQKQSKHTSKQNKNKHSTSTDHLGEYVDYEEIE